MERKEMPPGLVSILGCGWVGLALARILAENGVNVRGSTTSPTRLRQIEAAGADAHLIHVGEEVEGDEVSAFLSADKMVVTLPPGRDASPDYVTRIGAVARALADSPVRHVVFTSSTSVYPDLGRVVTEEDADIEAPLKRSGAVLLAAERILLEAAGFETTVLRLGGLIGYDRQPGRFLAGRTGLPDGDAPVNLVHRDDVVEVIRRVLAGPPRQTVWNVCAGAHPRRRDFYPEQARLLGLGPPTFAEDDGGGHKIVSSERLRRELPYAFIYPDPADV
jgi:nucleoside-diphosphate-sugar epimerase